MEQRTLEQIQLDKLKVIWEVANTLERLESLTDQVTQILALETMKVFALEEHDIDRPLGNEVAGPAQRSGKAGWDIDREQILTNGRATPPNTPSESSEPSEVTLEELDDLKTEDEPINYPEDAPLVYDSDLDKDDCGCDDDDIITFKNNSPYHKMDTILTILENNTLNEIIDYVKENHPDIQVNPRSSIPSLTQALLLEAYEKASERQVVATMGRVRELINAQTTSLNQKSKRFSQLRQVLKARFGEDSKVFKKHQRLGMTYEQHTTKQKVSKSNRKERLEDRIQITDTQVREILHQHSASNDVFDQIIAVMLATGSRLIEALRLTTYKRSDRGDDWIHVSTLAKKKEPIGLNRPLLGLDVDEVLELVKETRKELKKRYPDYATLLNDDLTKKLDGRVNSRIKKLGLEGVESSHTLRKLYANLTYKLLSKDERAKIDLHQYIQNTLGHESIDTASNYANVKIGRSGVSLKNQEDIETKLNAIDEKDQKQDVHIDDLKQDVNSCKDNTVLVKNKRNDTVQVLDHADNQRGKAVARGKAIMDDLHSKGVKITEKILKAEFHLGSNTIAQLKEYKRQLNDRL
jgi:hypothetical protein